MAGTERSRISELALLWLLTRAQGKGSRNDLSRALKPLVEHRWSSGEWSAQLDQSLASLETDGLVQQTARKGLNLTAEGRQQAVEALGVERPPKGLTWKQLRLKYLTAKSLGLSPSAANVARLGSADGLRAVLVQKQSGLGEPGTRSLAQVRDALCWKQLGVDSDKPFTLTAVQSFLLGKVLQASREVSPAQALQQLAARSVGARRTGAESLRLAALQSWLIPTQETGPDPEPPTTGSEPPAIDSEEALSSFAERVLHTARSATSGRFGEDRVFISHIWRAMQHPGLDEQSFKNRLIEANQKRLLSLSRADMVELMDPADVAASETRYLGATFHFIAL
ncbi:hypothetical protein [Stigmatella aurantiaca]|uniref:Conserved uncharacterized protein n=1 Tax=Stigmatella aurantiaca (strain DW4/3-1) TaxID=378806 RepID=Q094W1_STIAD|nr:hypothetical protein [Stigmatella aurantiaca]ADO71361.1 conserved uncharacterized protein [Stigmatella aurantiaca DW4/3-1]EAU67265.1 hypothetical protein STIAU_4965 [Stigmatella aurantiaca DW4/3-1]